MFLFYYYFSSFFLHFHSLSSTCELGSKFQVSSSSGSSFKINYKIPPGPRHTRKRVNKNMVKNAETNKQDIEQINSRLLTAEYKLWFNKFVNIDKANSPKFCI